MHRCCFPSISSVRTQKQQIIPDPAPVQLSETSKVGRTFGFNVSEAESRSRLRAYVADLPQSFEALPDSEIDEAQLYSIEQDPEIKDFDDFNVAFCRKFRNEQVRYVERPREVERSADGDTSDTVTYRDLLVVSSLGLSKDHDVLWKVQEHCRAQAKSKTMHPEVMTGLEEGVGALRDRSREILQEFRQLYKAPQTLSLDQIHSWVDKSTEWYKEATNLREALILNGVHMPCLGQMFEVDSSGSGFASNVSS